MYSKPKKAIISLIVLLLVSPNISFAKSFSKSIAKYPIYDESESNCLAKAIYFEARGEPEITKKAVAKVILNRKKHLKFPKTICSVVFQAKRDSRGKVCQFSWVCSKPTFDSSDQAWIDAKELSKSILSDLIKLPNFNSDVLFFKSTRCNNSFGIGYNKLIAKYGETNFYEKKII